MADKFEVGDLVTRVGRDNDVLTIMDLFPSNHEKEYCYVTQKNGPPYSTAWPYRLLRKLTPEEATLRLLAGPDNEYVSTTASISIH